ncbi:hypothetical protein [Spirosoma litoris]
MTPALTPPSPIIADLTGVDNVIGIIKQELSALTWLENSLGRVKPEYKANSSLPEPWIYKADGEYYQAYPNDTLTSFSCLYAHEDEQFDQYGFFGKRTLSAIVWADLKALRIDPPTLEGLKQDVIQKLRGLYCVMSDKGFKSYDQTVSGANAVYPNFDVSGLDSKYLSYPYGGFRIEMTVHYTNLCNPI